MRKAMVAVGVDKTASDFPLLKAAALGAVQIADWGKTQGFDVTLLTDQAGKAVALNDVFQAVSALVNARVYSQLVVYFSGHGVLLSPDTEVWLLSGALDSPNEAINVSGSIVAARTSGVEHVVFVSDACRSMPVGFRMGMVSPGLIFPSRTPRAPVPEVDVFYATLPGDPALEVAPDEAEKSFRGLLTSCMLKALAGTPTSLVEQVQDVVTGQKRSVVASRQLKLHLTRAVPDAASAVSIKLRQDPDVRIESALPKYLAEIVDAGIARRPSDGLLDKTPSKTTMAYALTKSWKTAVLDRTSLSNELTVPDNLQNSVDHIVDSAGRLSFETRTGFTVHGSALQYARVTGVSCDVFAEGGAQQVRVHADYEPVNPRNKFQKRAALLRFGDGTGIVLAVLPGYVGSVVLEDHRVVTVNYTPSRGTRNFTEYKYAGRDLERRRAFVAVAARNGSFRLDPEAAQGTAQYLRMLKQVDPTLGLYAAYAYAQAGDGKGVVSVYRYMEREPEPVIFDVGMLAARQIPQAQRTLDFAPWMPMLTQGWMLLGDFANAMPEPLRRARAHLLPGLWTTFAPEGMDVLEAEIFGGLKL